MTELTAETFEAFIKNSGVVVVDFYATWCAPCKVMSRTLEHVGETLPELKIGKVNIDDFNELAEKYGIRSLPTLVYFRDGVVVGNMVGAKYKSTDIVELVRALQVPKGQQDEQ